MQELVLNQPVSRAGSELVREAAQADARREFEERLAECGPLAFRVACGVLRNTADAEDVAQEALLRAYQSFERLRDRNRFRGWLVRISFRLALDRLRSARRALVPAGRSSAAGHRRGRRGFKSVSRPPRARFAGIAG